MALKHSGTLSSNGIETTTQANQVIEFTNPTNSLSITAIDNNITIKINNETNSHFVTIGQTLQIEDMRINKITIVESSVNYIYHALYY